MAARLILWGAMLKPISWTVIVSTAKKSIKEYPLDMLILQQKSWYKHIQARFDHGTIYIYIYIYLKTLFNDVSWLRQDVSPLCFHPSRPSLIGFFLLWSRESCRQRTIALGRFLWSVQSDTTQLWRHIKDTVDGPAKSESPVDKWFIPLYPIIWLGKHNMFHPSKVVMQDFAGPPYVHTEWDHWIIAGPLLTYWRSGQKVYSVWPWLLVISTVWKAHRNRMYTVIPEK